MKKKSDSPNKLHTLEDKFLITGADTPRDKVCPTRAYDSEEQAVRVATQYAQQTPHRAYIVWKPVKIVEQDRGSQPLRRRRT